MAAEYPVSKLNKLRQLREKGRYDRDSVHRLLGAARLELTSDDLHEIKAAVASITVQGARYTERLQKFVDR